MFLLELTDDSQMILCAGRATCTRDGAVMFEDENAGTGDTWSRCYIVPSNRVKAAYTRRTNPDGTARWVRQPSTAPWRAF